MVDPEAFGDAQSDVNVCFRRVPGRAQSFDEMFQEPNDDISGVISSWSDGVDGDTYFQIKSWETLLILEDIREKRPRCFTKSGTVMRQDSYTEGRNPSAVVSRKSLSNIAE